MLSKQHNSAVKRYALFSVNQTENIAEFAKSVSALGWSIVATDQPLKVLRDAGIDVMSVAEFVGVREEYGFPPTLHPKIEYALTAKEPNERIELVYNITYSLDVGNDVGGHTLLALAVKGNRVPVSTYDDMNEVAAAIEKLGGIPAGLRDTLVEKASLKISKHYGMLLSQNCGSLVFSRAYGLLNGENPYQLPAELMSEDGCADSLALHKFQLLTDNKPCFTNMADLDCIVETISKAAQAFILNRGGMPFITIAAKHGNACGIGVDWDNPLTAIKKALWGNPLAVWGGEIAVNFKLDRTACAMLYSSEERLKMCGSDKWMLDVLAAPEIEMSGLNILTRQKNTKIFVNAAMLAPKIPVGKLVYRFVHGGALRQAANNYVLDIKNAWRLQRPITEEEIDSIIIAWACAFTSFHGGNEIAIASGRQLLCAGGGPSTVDAAETAVQRGCKYGKMLKGASFAADAFFPFTDAVEVLLKAGCTSGVAPAGGINEKRSLIF